MNFLKFYASCLAIIATSASALEFGEWTTSNGSNISVEEDFMDSRYPRHVIALRPDGADRKDGWLVLRCQQNKTEVFFSSGPFDFFGRGREPSVSLRFPDDANASSANISLSSDGEAIFFTDPVTFITKMLNGGFVGLGGSYYSSAFRHKFTLDPQLRDAIYDMAETCEWLDQVTEIPAPVDTIANPIDTDRQALDAGLSALIQEFGLEQVSQALTDLK